MENNKIKILNEKYVTRSGKNHWAWKGKTVGYVALHEWIYKRKGKAVLCELCGSTKIPKGKKRWFHWANKSKKYKRDLEDWWQLCILCHRKEDNWQQKIREKFMKSKCWEKRSRNKLTGQFN